MTEPAARAAVAVVVLNLLLFLFLTTAPAYQAAHHHWIFPLLAAALAAQWLATFLHARLAPARSHLLSLLVFLLCLGVVRHVTILTCFDRCSFKLAAAAAIAAPVFLLHAFTREGGWWTPRRARLAALGAGLWSLYLYVAALFFAPWSIRLGFSIAAALLWLGRSRAEVLLLALGVASGVLIREFAGEGARILLGLLWGVALPLAAVERFQAWLDSLPSPKPLPGPAKTTLTALVLAVLGFYVVGPVFLMTDRAEREKRLARMAPPQTEQDPKKLSPLAARLRGHVYALAHDIGERDAFSPAKQLRARDYVAARFKAAGYRPSIDEYEAQWMAEIKNGVKFHNVEAVLALPPADRGAAWVVGAHYDSAPGTPGADDNASGVAVLLEAARLLKARKPERDIRFVAYGTEEPPAFGTRNMGSAHHARKMKENGVKVHAMLSLEMLGFYNPRPGSQFYPPFMHLLYPDRADFVGVVANVPSRGLLADFVRHWRAGSRFPLTASILPGPLSGLALSDQLSYWDQGFPALMLSDTAFYRNPHYHQHSDLADTLDYEKMAQVTLALVETLDPPR